MAMLGNTWMLDYIITIFSMVLCSKYDYLQHGVFPLKKYKQNKPNPEEI